jgi:hypothetical protein
VFPSCAGHIIPAASLTPYQTEAAPAELARLRPASDKATAKQARAPVLRRDPAFAEAPAGKAPRSGDYRVKIHNSVAAQERDREAGDG